MADCGDKEDIVNTRLGLFLVSRTVCVRCRWWRIISRKEFISCKRYLFSIMAHRQNRRKTEIPQCFIWWKCYPWVQEESVELLYNCVYSTGTPSFKCTRNKMMNSKHHQCFFFKKSFCISFSPHAQLSPAALLSLFTAVNRSAVVANWSPECVWSEPDIRTSGSSSTCSTRQTEQAVLLKTWRFDVASSIRSSPSPPTLKESIFLFWTPPHIRLIVPLHGWCPISRILWPVLALQSWSFQSGQSARFSRYPRF